MARKHHKQAKTKTKAKVEVEVEVEAKVKVQSSLDAEVKAVAIDKNEVVSKNINANSDDNTVVELITPTKASSKFQRRSTDKVAGHAGNRKRGLISNVKSKRDIWGDRLFNWLTGTLTAVAMASILGLLVIVIADPSATGPMYLALVNINLVFAIAFIFLVGKRVISIFVERKKSLVGTRLHIKLLGIFVALAILPAVVVGGFSVFLLNQGIETWFSSRVSAAFDGSLQVAQAYLKEHQKSLLIEGRVISSRVSQNGAGLGLDNTNIKNILDKERKERHLADLSIYDKQGTLISYAGYIPPVPPSAEMLSYFAHSSEISVNSDMGITRQNFDERRVSAVTRVGVDTFLVLSRWIDASVLARVGNTQDAYKEYYQLRSQSDTVRLVFTLFLVVLITATLAGAIWAGLNIASRIIRPVTALVHGTNKVSSGDLDVRLVPLDDDEIGILTQSFNRMTKQLKENRELLERKNNELNDKRRITEAVFKGVSAGVLSLDVNGTVLLVNQNATDTLEVKIGDNIQDSNQEIYNMLRYFAENNQPIFQQQIRIANQEENRAFLVRMVSQQRSKGEVRSVVVTFDDITELLSAQKVAAWSDVARRIAHEIKNPLTPIQLCAERLRRRYTKILPEEDRELFQQLTATIGRQVEDMRLMVNEFSDFARMPAAVMVKDDVISILNDVIVLQKAARSDIDFETIYPQGAEKNGIDIYCDRSHLQRAFTNIIENAVNAIEEKEENKKDGKNAIKVVVEMSLYGKLVITVTDSGRGLPENLDTDNLFDPYVTTREKGTGLGLSIVRRVIDEHGGQVRLMRREEGGTSVEMTFSAKNKS